MVTNLTNLSNSQTGENSENWLRLSTVSIQHAEKIFCLHRPHSRNVPHAHMDDDRQALATAGDSVSKA